MEEWLAQLLVIVIVLTPLVISSPMPSHWYPDHPYQVQKQKKLRGRPP